MSRISIVEARTANRSKSSSSSRCVCMRTAQLCAPLISDEFGALSREDNPVYETADAILLLAVCEGETVGRIAAF